MFISFQEVVHIRALEQRILTEGRVLPGEVLKVGSFLNQQIDTKLLKEMGDEVARLFSQSNVTKVLTIESSGIALAYSAAVALYENTDMDAETIVRKSLEIASNICVYTNNNISVEKLGEDK